MTDEPFDFGARLLEIGQEYQKRIEQIEATWRGKVKPLEDAQDIIWKPIKKARAEFNKQFDALEKKAKAHFGVAMTKATTEKAEARDKAVETYVDDSYKAKDKLKSRQGAVISTTAAKSDMPSFPTGGDNAGASDDTH